VKKEKIDFLLAVGGGSVIDGTKFISAASLFDGNAWDILSKKVEIKKAISFATVLTLPASGSEMNNGAVISRKESHEKLVFSNELVYPQFSILDPSVCTSLPKEQIANGIIDAFVHVIEQYLTFPVNSPLQDRFAESILNTLIEEGPKLFANSSDYESAGNIMWCATMALNGLIVCGVPEDWSTHMIGHELTSLTGIDHAQTLAIVLPGVLSVMKENKKIKLLQYAEKVWNIDEVDESKKINLAIEKTEKFFHFFNVKTKLSDYKVSLGVIDEIVARFEKRQLKLGERSDITSDKVREILRVRL
ncbi:aldehyde reductase, partial [Candidatus Peregrinibacteria bacterium RIFOXYA12_FULL_33_12]